MSQIVLGPLSTRRFVCVVRLCMHSIAISGFYMQTLIVRLVDGERSKGQKMSIFFFNSIFWNERTTKPDTHFFVGSHHVSLLNFSFEWRAAEKWQNYLANKIVMFIFCSRTPVCGPATTTAITSKERLTNVPCTVVRGI